MPENIKENMQTLNAGIIVIGDEVLKGQIQDTNTFYLTKELKNCGVQVQKVSILPDQIDEIAQEIREFCAQFKFVFTCGGVGPTHDDVTFEAVAKAFNQDLALSTEIIEVLETHFKDGLNDSMLKMARVPKTAQVDYSKTGTDSFPVISIQNLFILPGVPKLLQQTFSVIASELSLKFASKHKMVVIEIFIAATEFEITHELNRLVKKYDKSVTFGSYPSWDHNYYQTKLTLEASDENLISNVSKEIQDCMPVLGLDNCPQLKCHDKIKTFLSNNSDSGFVQAVQTSQRVIEECFNKYSLEQIIIAFNGGKDCMALLHLVHAYLEHQGLQDQKLKALYIRDTDPFEKVEDFIDNAAATYNLDLITIQAPMKEALTQMLQSQTQIKATLMGTRMGDPGSKGQSHFSPTDGNWPSLMRVNPILHWQYEYIWTFLRGLCLPYPVLYDQGYTSLGGKSNTSPNPHLQGANGKFLPAHQLKDGALERAGRVKKKSA